MKKMDLNGIAFEIPIEVFMSMLEDVHPYDQIYYNVTVELEEVYREDDHIFVSLAPVKLPPKAV